MIDPRVRRLQLFTGKGGVGKTTVVAGVALAWAERGRRPLIVELGHRASIEGVIGSGAIGWDPIEVAPGVHATNVDGARAVLEVLARWLVVRRFASRLLRTETMQAFVGAAPGVVEAATIERLFVLLDEGWDPILVDADASGHAKMFLGLSRVFADLGAGGALAGLLARSRALFADPARAALHLVTLPGALPIQETIELDAELRAGEHVALGSIFVSRAPEAPALQLERVEALRAHAKARGEDALGADLALLARDVGLAEEGRARIEELAARSGRAPVRLPDLERADRDALLALGRVALEGVP